MNTPTPSLTIGTVAKRAGVPIDTIRYYEREGLLPEPLRRASGYRSYNETAVSRLRFIRRAKELGFTLEEIRDLLALSSDRRGGVKAVRKRAEQRLASIETRIAELMRIRKGLQQLIQACPGHGDPEHCPILRALADEEPQA
ncbi:heavy metal-responsive transcriptional regulator [Dyella acidisoli]|uniref:Transcriptional regulator n=1 Tax=Dyella acidisoli TaxID=1867834 RepID=A0ABQ5XSQ5_9GAMM|nr:heavy metal-responsive transcriptional regulator [Dyella acidisoli]GLQ94013.1 transcriptional regulator [Dyella acidisoli]